MANSSTRDSKHPNARQTIRDDVPVFGRRSADRLAAAVLLQTLPPETLMPKALADSHALDIKHATKAAVLKGITKPPKHVPRSMTTPIKTKALEGGIDSTPAGVVQSGFSAFNPTSNGAKTMTKTTETKTPATPAVDAGAAQAKREADAKAALEAKMKANAEKEAAKAAREAKAVAAATERAEAKAAREATVATNKAAREARIAELEASGKKYTGSMLALAERVKAGVYVKSMTGQLRSTDELAVALDAVPPENVVKLGCLIFGEANKYTALNIGQQSMNYRNRIRGAIKAGDRKMGEDVITLDLVKKLRDDNGFATAEAEVAAKKATAEAKAKAKADKEAAAAAAKDKAEKEKAAAAIEKAKAQKELEAQKERERIAAEKVAAKQKAETEKAMAKEAKKAK